MCRSQQRPQYRGRRPLSGRAERHSGVVTREARRTGVEAADLNGGHWRASAVKPPQPASGRSRSAARLDHDDHGHADIQLEDALERTNLQRALHRVERNGGAPGIDGMTTAELRPYLREHWPALARALLSGTYQPQPVRRVEIPKPGGGTRQLGIPTVRDRFLQQALLQALQPASSASLPSRATAFDPSGRRIRP